MTDTDFAVRVLDVFARADLHDSLWWRTDGAYAPVTFWVQCSDVFAWGVADAELLPPEALDDFEQALQDVVAVVGANAYGPELYCARRRGKRPQGAAYPSDERLWPLFDACGPEREIGLGNPYLPGRRKPKTAAHDQLRQHLYAVHHNLAGLGLSDADALEQHRDEHGKLWRHEADDLSWTDGEAAIADAERLELG